MTGKFRRMNSPRRARRGGHASIHGDHLCNRGFLTIILPSLFTKLVPLSLHLLEQPIFPFKQLPCEVQIKIFRLVFVRQDLIHCLSRLDLSNPPLRDEFPESDDERRSHLPTGFHFGTRPCQIALARDPTTVLSPLLVSKRWHFIGVHAFYGHNTFAFSSLGEWHRFCNGISAARVERLANVELMWHGSLMRRHPTRISRRSLDLGWLTT
ncbi:hypothetical protein F4804DRAFT_318389 [Jackrogersella minutella]|nr:hypothetical protein F4804DRAFT_318389 [Jackrogersella minutella]